MTRSKKNCRRAPHVKGNSKAVDQAMKGRKERLNKNSSIFPSESHEYNSTRLVLRDVECRKDNPDDSNTCLPVDISFKFESSVMDENEDCEYQSQQIRNHICTPSEDNTIYICQESMSSDESSILSFSPLSSVLGAHDRIAETDSLARRLFKSSNTDAVSRVIAPPSLSNLEPKYETPWKVYDSPWDFGFHFKDIFSDGFDNHGSDMYQGSPSSWGDNKKSTDLDDACTDGKGPFHEIHRCEPSDVWIGPPCQAFLCGYNMYCPIFPSFSSGVYSDPTVFLNRPYIAGDFWVSRNLHGAVSNFPYSYHIY